MASLGAARRELWWTTIPGVRPSRPLVALTAVLYGPWRSQPSACRFADAPPPRRHAGDRTLYAAVSGMVNGCGSIGALLQGLVTSQLVAVVGWAGLFVALAAATLATSVVLLPAVAVERKALRREAKGGD